MTDLLLIRIIVYAGEATPSQVIEVFKEQFGNEVLVCSEHLSRATLRLYLRPNVNVDRILRAPLAFNGLELHCLSDNEKVKTVFLRGLPFDTPEKSIFEAVKKYGRVRSIGFERNPEHRPICTGTRVVKMRLDSAMPNFIHVDRFTATVSYKGLELVCRRCGGNGHLAKLCYTKRENFKEGFPVHTRPVRSKSTRVPNDSADSSRKSANKDIQAIADAIATAVIASLENLDTANSGLKKNKSTVLCSLAQKLNKTESEGVVINNPEPSTSSSSQMEISSAAEKPPVITNNNEKKKNSVPPSAGTSEMESSPTASGATGNNQSETNGSKSSSKKKRKKKKRTSKK